MIKRLMVVPIVAFVISLFIPAVVLAFNPFQSACSVTGAGSSSLCQGQSDGTTNPLVGSDGLLVGVARIIAVVTGVIAVVVIIIDGLRFVTSGGDAAKAKAARDSLISALIGLAVIALAGSIISFVLSRL